MLSLEFYAFSHADILLKIIYPCVKDLERVVIVEIGGFLGLTTARLNTVQDGVIHKTVIQNWLDRKDHVHRTASKDFLAGLKKFVPRNAERLENDYKCKFTYVTCSGQKGYL